MTLTNQNIEQLIVLCKSNNQFAQLEIYNRYHQAMFNVAYRIVKDRLEAEDIMQDSFLTAFTKLDALKESSTFTAWLKRIVVNNSIYFFNKSRNQQSIPLDDVLFKIENNDGVSSDYNYTHLKAKQVLKTMELLKDKYRIALTLHLIEGYDYQEMSTILNTSYANCRTTVSRAKQSLRKKIEQLTPNSYE